jgi:hypothetical protein
MPHLFWTFLCSKLHLALPGLTPGVDGDPVVRIAALPGGLAAAAGDGTVRLYAPACMGCGLASVP